VVVSFSDPLLGRFLLPGMRILVLIFAQLSLNTWLSIADYYSQEVAFTLSIVDRLSHHNDSQGYVLFHG
jgi:hypothetical protein